MSFYALIPFIMISILLILVIRSIILRRKNLPQELYFEALKIENSGHFEEAVVTYENALNEFIKKKRLDDNFKNKIVAKIKVMRTIIEYNNNLHFTRQYNSNEYQEINAT